MKKIKIIVPIVFGLTFMFLGLYFYSHRNINTPPPSLPLAKGEERARLPDEQGGGQGLKAFLEINGIRYEDAIVSQSTVYDLMNKLRKEGKIDFTEKNYAGMGKFIETINGLRGNGEKTWIYYVNGQKAQVGVSNYKLNPGDVVSWKYEKLLAY